jgi:hypothetical protein
MKDKLGDAGTLADPTGQEPDRTNAARATTGTKGNITIWTRQNGPVGPFAGGSVHTDSTRPTTLARRPRPPGLRSGRRSSERSIPTVCSNPKNALDVPRMPEPHTSPASPICPLGREQRVRDDLAPSTAIWSSPIGRMHPPTTGSALPNRSATQRPNGLRHAHRWPGRYRLETWRGTLHRTVVGRCRPTTAQCRDFTLNRSADWTQLT